MMSSHTSRLLASGTGALLALASAAVGVVVTQTSAVGEQAEAVVFHVGVGNEADSFNPFLGIEASSFEMWALMYDQMITYSDKDMSPQPGLAESWETSDDGMTWTFDIRTGVMWSDGQPLTAADIAYTYNRILDGGPESATWGSYLKSVKTVSAPDDETVELELSEPNAVLPLLPIPVIPEHIWADVSEEEAKSYPNEPENGEPVVGSGPFRLVEGSAGGSTYRFEVNPDYWQGRPSLDEVLFTVFRNEDTLVQALIKGDVDFAEGLTPLQIDSLAPHDEITTVLGDSPGFDEIGFNTGAIDVDTGEPIGDGNPALQDADFRYALGFAIDRDVIIEKVYQGGGLAGDTIVPPAYSSFHWDPPAEVAQTYDPERAGQLLDEAGYQMGTDGRRTMPDGSPIGTMRLIARSESTTSLGVMQYFKEWLADIGIDAEVETMESGKLTNVILEGNFDAFEWGWYVEPDPDSMLTYMTCDQLGSWSDSWYCNEEYDRLYDAQHSEMDEEARAEMVRQMQEMVYLDAPYLVTAYSKIGEAYRSDRFTCFTPQPNPGGVLLFQYGARNYVTGAPTGSDACNEAESSSAADSSADDSGLSTTALVVGGLILLGVIAALVTLGMRRRATASERA